MKKQPKNPGSNEVTFKNVSRYTTAEEKNLIKSIELDPKDIDEFIEMFKKGLIEASSGAQQAVQDNFALRIESTIRVSRPVYNEKNDVVEDLVGKADVIGKISAKKNYKK